MKTLLPALRAAGEPTRLRILALLARNELTVSELTRILGQSQPRVSRHLRLLTEARLLERFQEGAWVFHRLAETGPGADLAQALLQLLPEGDLELRRDRERLEEIRHDHAQAASAYFSRMAERWDRIRSLYVPESEVEAAMLEAVGENPGDDFLDLGTGTGRILQVFGQRVHRGLGVDSSREMLAVARARLEHAALPHCQVRLGDIRSLNLPDGCMDVVTIHHVLHFLDDPGAAVREAARMLRPSATLLIVDFAPHALEFLRTDHAHRRLGFGESEVASWCESAGLIGVTARHLSASRSKNTRSLTVSIWRAFQRPDAPAHYRLEVA